MSATKYLIVTGGVISSLGKGLTAASIAMLLESRGLRVGMLKFDPYLNVDPGTMNPLQHGEVYVTDDGAETDLDLGHYYRFSNAPLSKASNVTTGQVYDTILKRERRGDFLGKTVQVVPHVTDEIKARILRAVESAGHPDIMIVEIGGTVGDIESLPFMEAVRQFRNEWFGKCLNIHLTYVPYLKAAGEVKTKPSQHSVQMLRQIGIVPDMILCRSEHPLDQEIRDKIALFCSVPPDRVIDEPDVANSIYEVPLMLHAQDLDAKIMTLLGVTGHAAKLEAWQNMLDKLLHPKGEVCIGVVGKYLQHKDAYKSVFEALQHAAIYHQVTLRICAIDSDREDIAEILPGCHGYLVPGGFGDRGWEGNILAAKYCREHHLPYFGICWGMQAMCAEFARHKAGVEGATSTEIDPETQRPVISLLSEQRGMQQLGGTMRLGAYPCVIAKGSKVFAAYKKELVSERHRHRYEFNAPEYRERLEKAGLTFSGVWRDQSTGSTIEVCEAAEVVDHPWMVGVQFHPEFQSKPTNPHPLFRDFIGATCQRS